MIFFATTTAVFRNQSEVFRLTHDLEVPQVLSRWVVVACCDKMSRRGRRRRHDVRMVRLDGASGEFLGDQQFGNISSLDQPVCKWELQRLDDLQGIWPEKRFADV